MINPTFIHLLYSVKSHILTWLCLLPAGNLYVMMPVVFSKKPLPSPRWRAYFDPETLDLQNPSIFILPPASASLGFYRFRLSVLNGGRWKAAANSRFALLCNPWCSGESLS